MPRGHKTTRQKPNRHHYDTRSSTNALQDSTRHHYNTRSSANAPLRPPRASVVHFQAASTRSHSSSNAPAQRASESGNSRLRPIVSQQIPPRQTLVPKEWELADQRRKQRDWLEDASKDPNLWKIVRGWFRYRKSMLPVFQHLTFPQGRHPTDKQLLYALAEAEYFVWRAQTYLADLRSYSNRLFPKSEEDASRWVELAPQVTASLTEAEALVSKYRKKVQEVVRCKQLDRRDDSWDILAAFEAVERHRTCNSNATTAAEQRFQTEIQRLQPAFRDWAIFRRTAYELVDDTTQLTVNSSAADERRIGREFWLRVWQLPEEHQIWVSRQPAVVERHQRLMQTREEASRQRLAQGSGHPRG